MWIVARFIIAIGSFLYRLLFRSTPSRYDWVHGSLSYDLREVLHKGKVTKRYLETPVDSAFICCLTRETFWDRFLKRLGFGGELQTQDSLFDSRIYVLGDHPLTAAYLGARPEVRSVILELIPRYLVSISITGKSLRFELHATTDPSAVLDELKICSEALAAVQIDVRSRFSDPFYLRAILIESVIWGVVGYAALAWGEYMLDVTRPHFLFPGAVVLYGAAMAVLALAGALGIVMLLLGRSSYAPRVITDNVLLLVIALPFIGYQSLWDINIEFDTTPGWEVSCSVASLNKVRHRGRRGRVYYTYFFTPELPPDANSLPFAVPKSIEISGGLYSRLQVGSPIVVDIGGGALGLPWYRRISERERALGRY
jgi:hypothetical protein